MGEHRMAELSERETATLAGGCFWCMVHPFDTWPGVIQVTSGYTGGHQPNPTYEEVCSGTTGHLEAVQVVFNPKLTSYRALIDRFWQEIDPTDAGGQFADRGSSYQTAIFYHSEDQHRQALASMQALEASRRFDRPIATKILPAGPFYPAEAYHQNYYQKNPGHYQRYRQGSGRDRFIQQHWPEKK